MPEHILTVRTKNPIIIHNITKKNNLQAIGEA